MPRKASSRPPPRSSRKGAGIVSSSHLVSPRSAELSEFEFGLIVAWNAFSRWAMRCMAAAGVGDLTITVFVPEDKYGALKLGQIATVTVDSFPGVTFTATVTATAVVVGTARGK